MVLNALRTSSYALLADASMAAYQPTRACASRPAMSSSAVAFGLLALVTCASCADDVVPPGERSSRLGEISSPLGVTGAFARPPAHPALDFSDARVSRRGLASAASVGAPEQVHLLPAGPGEVTVVWATSEALPDVDVAVTYRRVEREDERNGPDASARAARVSTTAYTAQICLGESMNVDPVMGEERHPVRVEDLVQLANTSRWASPDAANYRVVTDPSQVIPADWFHHPPWEKTLCLAYNNPDAQYQSPLLRRATLVGLRGGEAYAYRLPGDPSHVERRFRAPPAAIRASEYESTRRAKGAEGAAKARNANGRVAFGVVGDTGQTEVTAAVLEHLASMPDLDLLLHTGDLSYADGFPPRWDSFGRLAEPLMSRVPALVVPGNHDVTLNGAESTAYRTRYPTPHVSSGSPSPDWWSYDVGLAHVVGMSSYAPVGPERGLFDGAEAPMREWLRADLSRVDRDATPWIIAVFHVPWYNSNAGHFKEAERHRAALERTLYDAGVDVVLNGHVHSYERTVPTFDGAPDPCGAAHLVVGDGGNYEGPYGDGWRDPQPAWSAFREGSFGAGRLEIHNATHATWEWRRTTCVAPEGTNDAGEPRYAPTGDHGEECQSIGDVSAQAMRAVDRAVFVRDVEACPNRRAGSGAGPRKPSPNDDGERDDANASTGTNGVVVGFIAFLIFAWIATSAALVRALTLLRRERTEMNAASRRVLMEEDF